jgi:hypothetical protein
VLGPVTGAVQCLSHKGIQRRELPTGLGPTSLPPFDARDRGLSSDRVTLLELRMAR